MNRVKLNKLKKKTKVNKVKPKLNSIEEEIDICLSILSTQIDDLRQEVESQDKRIDRLEALMALVSSGHLNISDVPEEDWEEEDEAWWITKKDTGTEGNCL